MASWKITLFSCVLFSLLVLCNGQFKKLSETDKLALASPEVVQQKWMHLISRTKGLMEYGVKMLLPKLMESAGTLNISASCVRDSMKLMWGLRKLKAWAVAFVDSSSKSIDGFLSVKLAELGAYDECVNNVVTNSRSGRNKGQVLFTGKYCTVFIKPYLFPKTYVNDSLEKLLVNASIDDTIFSELFEFSQLLDMVSIRLGACVPSGCSKDDLNEFLKIGSDNLGIVIRAERCEIKKEIEVTPLMIGVMSLFSFIGLLLALGSLMDIYTYYTGKKFEGIGFSIVKSFSFITNFQKLTKTETTSDVLSCFHGMRFLGMSWVVLAHTYSSIAFLLHGLPRDAKKLAREFAFYIIGNPSPVVDSFFLMTGFLICYSMTKLIKIEKRPFNVVMYIIHRFWRLLPSLIFLILYMQLLPLHVNGPIATESLNIVLQPCKEKWWASILFISNYLTPGDICNSQTWYLSVDVQLYIGSLIVLIPLMRSTKLGIIICISAIVAGIVSTGTIYYVYNLTLLTGVYLLGFEESERSAILDYMSPHAHISSYCIGILCGYLVAMRPNLKIPKNVQVLGWCTATFFTMSAIYGPYWWYIGSGPTKIETVIYGSTYRTAWVLGVSWMIVCCCTGHGGVINYILSWKVWIPVARLSFMTYIIHPVVIFCYMANTRTAMDFKSHYVLVWLFLGNLVVSTACAFAASMLIEAPFLSLEKIVFSKFVRQSKSSTSKEAERNCNKAINGDGDNTFNVISATEIPTSTNLKDNTQFVCRL